MTTEIFNDELQVKHLLKADPFGQSIIVHNKENNRVINLVDDTNDFFEHIYVEPNGILGVDGVFRNITIDKWLEENNNFSDFLNCQLFFVEGYAGCGKSTLVQHILYKVLNNPNYDYNYYNYDVGSYFDTGDVDKENGSDLIKYSISYGLKKQIIAILGTNEGQAIFNRFLCLMKDEEAIVKLDGSRQIKTRFGTAAVFTATVNIVLKSSGTERTPAIEELDSVIEEQLNRLSLYQLLCVDYLWRLAQYLVLPQFYRKCMYVCYDNLDSIMDIDVLCNFKDNLIIFRDKLNDYMSYLNKIISRNGRLYGETACSIKSFVIFATYRKITAVRSDLANREMLEDMQQEYVQVIEVSKQYKFTNIAENRIDHFSSKFRTTNICGKKADSLIKQMKKIEEVKDMYFVNTTYAGLWNYNLRACSNVLSELVEHNSCEIDKCIALYKENIDGYNPEKYCYFGASSLFLHAICKMLKRMKIFDSNHLDLINIKEDALARNTSLSRLIITYLCTKNESVPITELFEVFDRVFEPEYICKILGQLIKRVSGEIWRRPIYYSKYALNNENDIQNKLFKQYQKYKANEQYKYTEFRICDCGETYINTIVPQFEFYAARINLSYSNLYNIVEIKELKTVLQSVFEKIEICCEKQIEFAKSYIEKYNLDISDYLTLPFHPRTRNGNPQLHIERVIFSHLEYFNKYRMYLIKKGKPNYNIFNDIILEYIEKYLCLYKKYILKICANRKEVADRMEKKLKVAMERDKYIPIEA